MVLLVKIIKAFLSCFLLFKASKHFWICFHEKQILAKLLFFKSPGKIKQLLDEKYMGISFFSLSLFWVQSIYLLLGEDKGWFWWKVVCVKATSFSPWLFCLQCRNAIKKKKPHSIVFNIVFLWRPMGRAEQITGARTSVLFDPGLSWIDKFGL